MQCPTIILVLLFASVSAKGADRHTVEIDRCLAQLASDDWKVRQQATDRLIQLGDDALARLERVATSAGADDEVRTRAAAAIVQIEENRVTGRSLVTLSLKDVPAAQAFAELARQARATLPGDPPSLWPQKSLRRVSLEVDHRPFWEVMQTLCAQTGLEPTPVTRQNREMGLGLPRGDAEWADKPIALAGPLLVRADRINRTSTIPLLPPREVQREFNISLTVYAEPKLRVLDYSGTVTLKEVVDERGNSLIPPAENGVPANVEVFGNQREGNTSRWEVGATLHYPKDAGRKIARFRATTTLQVQTRAARLEVPIAGARNLARTLDGVRVTVKNLETTRCELSIQRDGRSDAEWYGLRMQLGAGHAQLQDDQGVVVARHQNGMEADESSDGQRMDLRFRFAREAADDGSKDGKKRSLSEATKLIWEFPVEIRELAVPFELRDLDIP